MFEFKGKCGSNSLIYLVSHTAKYRIITKYTIEGYQLSLWRNWLARSAVNRKVCGYSPPRDDLIAYLLLCVSIYVHLYAYFIY